MKAWLKEHANNTTRRILTWMFDGGKYKAAIDMTYPMSQIVEAHRYVDQGKKLGNVVIKVV